MKALLVAAALSLLAGCTSETSLGPCIGAFDDENPKLAYKVDKGNVLVGLLFMETFVVPGIVVLDEWKCPISWKAPAI